MQAISCFANDLKYIQKFLSKSLKNDNYIINSHKKGDIIDKAPWLVSLLVLTFKLFIKIITSIISAILDWKQARKQDELCSGYSTIDHIQVINQFAEKSELYIKLLKEKHKNNTITINSIKRGNLSGKVWGKATQSPQVFSR